jgi:hypothetical protein
MSLYRRGCRTNDDWGMKRKNELRPVNAQPLYTEREDGFFPEDFLSNQEDGWRIKEDLLRDPHKKGVCVVLKRLALFVLFSFLLNRFIKMKALNQCQEDGRMITEDLLGDPRKGRKFVFLK